MMGVISAPSRRPSPMGQGKDSEVARGFGVESVGSLVSAGLELEGF